MQRRRFIKFAGAAGFTTLIPWWRPGLAQTALYTGTVFMNIHARGAWDTSSFCDPKNDPQINRWAENAQAGNAGNLRYAPFAGNQAFFNKYFDRMLVINGIDGETNSHEAGLRHSQSGRLASGYPPFEGLAGIVLGAGLPLYFLANGPYRETADGAVLASSAPGNDGLGNLLLPNRNPEGQNIHPEAALDIARRHQLDRLRALAAGSHLPRMKRGVSELIAGKSGDDALRTFGEGFQNLDRNDLTGARNDMVDDIHLALLASAAGLCVSANFDAADFDTHSDHDRNQARALRRLTNAVDYLWVKADELGVAERIVLVLTSDFSRTPRYNDGNGKDHWSVGSTVIMQKDAPWGNRVVGATNGRHDAVRINPMTLQPDDSGIKLEPKHIHQALRTLSGIDGDPLVQRFALDAEDVDFFNPAVETGFPS
ncbi:MAG: DUF1501 domain-containing protein [Gammaproteobacteria bacterium]